MAEQGHLLERIAYYLEMARQGALESRFHLPTREEYRAFVMGPEAMDVERDTPAVEPEQSPDAAEDLMYRDVVPDDDVELLEYESDTPEFDDALDEADPDDYESTRAIRGSGEYDLQTPLGSALEDDPDYTARIVIDTSTSDGLSISEQLDAFEARLAALTQEQDFQQHIDRTEGMSY